MNMDYDTKNADRLNPSRLIVDRQSSALKQLLWRLVRSEKESDVLAPVTVVGPTRYANLSLRHEFGRGGFANVRFIAMPVLSELLGAAALAREGRRPTVKVRETLSLNPHWPSGAIIDPRRRRSRRTYPYAKRSSLTIGRRRSATRSSSRAPIRTAPIFAETVTSMWSSDWTTTSNLA